MGGVGRFFGEEQIAHRNHLPADIRDLDANGLFPRDRSQNSHVGRRHCVGDVFVEARDPIHLDTRSELQLEAANGRTNDYPDDARLDTMFREGVLQLATSLLDHRSVNVLTNTPLEQIHGRKGPRAGTWSGGGGIDTVGLG